MNVVPLRRWSWQKCRGRPAQMALAPCKADTLKEHHAASLALAECCFGMACELIFHVLAGLSCSPVSWLDTGRKNQYQKKLWRGCATQNWGCATPTICALHRGVRVKRYGGTLTTWLSSLRSSSSCRPGRAGVACANRPSGARA